MNPGPHRVGGSDVHQLWGQVLKLPTPQNSSPGNLSLFYHMVENNPVKFWGLWGREIHKMYGTWAPEWVNVIQPSTTSDQLCLGYATEIYGLLVTTESVDYLTTFSSVQSLSRVWLFATPWTAAHQTSLSITNSRSLPKLMSIESVMPSNHLSTSVIPFSSCPQSFPASGSFQMSQLFVSGGQSIQVSVSTSVLPINTQDWSPLGWTGWISLQSKGLSRIFNTTVQKHQFFGIQLSL